MMKQDFYSIFELKQPDTYRHWTYSSIKTNLQ